MGPAISRGSFARWAAIPLGLYVAIECAYVLRMPLVMDEFEGAYTVRLFANGLPYRDFSPYKTVLGYYLQLPALLAGGDFWRALLAVKFEMLLFVSIGLAVAASRLRRHFGDGATLWALALLVSMSDFLERSADLRVDMLTGLAGLFSLMLLLENRPGWAGAAAALSFLISQKGVYFLVAGVAGLAVCSLDPPDLRSALRPILRFGLGCTGVLAIYFIFWSVVSSPAIVFRTVFLAPRWVALGDRTDIHSFFWMQTLVRNPFFYALGLGAIIVMAAARSGNSRLLAGYGATVVALGYWHKQPWPYFFVLIAPTLFVLHAALLHRAWNTSARRILLAVCLLGGVLLPLSRLASTLLRSNDGQRWTLRFAHSLLGPGQEYLAGVDMLWDHDQTPPQLRWTDGATLRRLQAASPAETAALAALVSRAPIKLAIVNYRMASLPPLLREILRGKLAPLWGSVWIYSPTVPPGDFNLDFGGDYLVGPAAGPSGVVIDGQAVRPGSTVPLGAGRHRYDGPAPIRIQLRPRGWETFADPRRREPVDLFPAVYEY